ncbi:hypothetical protein M2432_001460 [Mycobacterium sp. OTB74]|jgi:hypothetical protein|nr:hypothetical protein [Mycobacterium sp. OTB74]
MVPNLSYHHRHGWLHHHRRGFLPDHNVTIRATYTAENISDHRSYVTDPGGDLYAQPLTSPATGALHITATNPPHRHRRRVRAAVEHTQTVQPRKAYSQRRRADDAQQAQTTAGRPPATAVRRRGVCPDSRSAERTAILPNHTDPTLNRSAEN